MTYRSNEELGRRLAGLREARGLSQVDVAEQLSYSPPVLSRIESGQRGLGAGEALEFADFFGVSVESILRDEEEGVLMLRAEVDSPEVRAALTEFDRDIENLLDLRAAVGQR